MPIVWRLREGATGEFARECEARNLVTLAFRRFGQSVERLNHAQIRALAKQRHEGGEWRSPASTLNRFANVMTVDDIVFVPTDDRKEYLVGGVAGGYMYAGAPIFKDYQHWRRVRWFGRAPLENFAGETIANLSSRNMLIQPRAQVRLMQWVREFADAMMDAPMTARCGWAGTAAAFLSTTRETWMWSPLTRLATITRTTPSPTAEEPEGWFEVIDRLLEMGRPDSAASNEPVDADALT